MEIAAVGLVHRWICAGPHGPWPQRRTRRQGCSGTVPYHDIQTPNGPGAGMGTVNGGCRHSCLPPPKLGLAPASMSLARGGHLDQPDMGGQLDQLAILLCPGTLPWLAYSSLPACSCPHPGAALAHDLHMAVARHHAESRLAAYIRAIHSSLRLARRHWASWGAALGLMRGGTGPHEGRHWASWGAALC